jgi:hypothetical protein
MKKFLMFMSLGLVIVLAGCVTESEPVKTQLTNPPATTTYTQDSWQTMIPETCQSFFDGCNNCGRVPENGEVACTMMYCENYQQPKCLDK